jgi:hypothetical protein
MLLLAGRGSSLAAILYKETFLDNVRGLIPEHCDHKG